MPSIYTPHDVSQENEELSARLREAEEIIRAIRDGEVDAVVVSKPEGEEVVTFETANRPYHVLADQMRDGAVTTSDDGRILFANHRFSQMVQVPSERLIGEQLQDYVVNIDSSVLEGMLSVARSRACKGDLTLPRINGSELAVHASFSPIPPQGSGHACGVFTDLTEQRLTEAAISGAMRTRADLEAERNAHARVSAVLESITDCYESFDREWRFVDINLAAEKAKYKRPREELRGKVLWEEYPQFIGSEMLKQYQRVASDMIPLHFECKSPVVGTWFEIHAYPTSNGVEAYLRDITERKRHEAEIEALNARLQRAMAETHHRVKNSLQVISALVDVQTINAGKTVPTAALLRVKQHVSAIATVHDLLTRESKTDGDVEYLYTSEILDKLRPLLESMVGKRRIHFTVEDLRLPIRQGTSLAVLVNELVSNAVKHGQGDIDLTLTVVKKGAELKVRDHGRGFPPDFNPKTAASTGLELIDSLGRWDLGGTVAFTTHPEGGGCVVVTFPVERVDQ